MRMGVNVPTFGRFADVRTLVELATLAESTGWDGFFLWDHIIWPYSHDLVDATVALSAIAVATERIRIGPMVTPMSRRRPAKVARESVTLDRLSGGRLIWGVGAGDFAEEFDDLGDCADAVTRAARLDEALSVLVGLWSGRTFNFEGEHFHVRETRFLPKAISTPRIPIWVGGMWPRSKPLARARKWDGFVPQRADGTDLKPDDVASIAGQLPLAANPAFDLVVAGVRGDATEYADAGATWWVDAPKPWEDSVDKLRKRIEAGPPTA